MIEITAIDFHVRRYSTEDIISILFIINVYTHSTNRL